MTMTSERYQQGRAMAYSPPTSLNSENIKYQLMLKDLVELSERLMNRYIQHMVQCEFNGWGDKKSEFASDVKRDIGYFEALLETQWHQGRGRG